MRFRGTLAARVALLVTVAVALAVAAVALAAYATVRHELYASLDNSLHDRAKAAAQSDAMAQLLSQGATSSILGAADVQIAILPAQGVDIVQGRDPGVDITLGKPELEVAGGSADWSVRTIYTSGGPYRVAAVPGHDPETALILAQSLKPTREALSTLGFVLALFGLLGVLAAGFAGWAVARNGLTPVRRLTDAVEEIARTEKLDPIPVEGEDEIARLAVSFNATLAALSASRDRQRQLVADAGHELRTPLTSLRTNLELLSQADSRGGLEPQSRTELMSDIQFQIAELTTLIGDLTELARDEPIPAQLEPVDLADVVEHAVARVRRRAADLSFDTDLEPWQVTGESGALERAVTNLLDNAAKWSPPLGTITVRLHQGTLYVADQGPGIRDEDLPHVFERFYRSRESRTMPGSGLGLSIVRKVAERHGGAVVAGSAPGGGAAFWMRVPASDAAPEMAARTKGTV
jgi:two-component system sensor histidine kinase MprB